MSQPPKDSPAASASAPVPPIPQPPRPVTSAVRRRAWNEPNIRAAWLAGIATALAVLYLAVTAIVDWREDNRLFSQGVSVRATAFAAGNKAPNRLIKSEYPLD